MKITADVRPRFINIAKKCFPIPIQVYAAFQMFTAGGNDCIAGPDYFISLYPRKNIKSPFLFPSVYIGFSDIGYHVNMTAVAAPAAFLGWIVIHRLFHVWILVDISYGITDADHLSESDITFLANERALISSPSSG